MIFVVTEISTGKEVYRYTSDETLSAAARRRPPVDKSGLRKQSKEYHK